MKEQDRKKQANIPTKWEDERESMAERCAKAVLPDVPALVNLEHLQNTTVMAIY